MIGRSRLRRRRRLGHRDQRRWDGRRGPGAAESLVTKGQEGLLFDHGSLSISIPMRAGGIEAGDVFSHLRGASIGGRLSWAAAAGQRRPSVAVYAPRRGIQGIRTVVSYRDQTSRCEGRRCSTPSRVRQVIFPEKPVSSVRDSSSKPSTGHNPGAVRSRDGSVSASAAVWRGVSLTGGLYQFCHAGDRSRLEHGCAAGCRSPLSRSDAGARIRSTRHTSHATSAVMATVTAGDLRLFHRQQYGEYDVRRGGFAGTHRTSADAVDDLVLAGAAR